MQKRLIALLLCAVLVSAMTVTTVVSAREVSNSDNQRGISFVLVHERLFFSDYSPLQKLVMWVIMQGWGLLGMAMNKLSQFTRGAPVQS